MQCIKKAGAAALSLGLVLSSFVPIMAPQVALAQAPVRTFSASTTPAVVVTGATQTFTVTITNDASSTDPIKSGHITLPSGFTFQNSPAPSLNGVTNWSICSSGQEIQFDQNNGGTDVNPGASFSVTFTATVAASAGNYTIVANAYKNSSCNPGGGAIFDGTSTPIAVVAAYAVTYDGNSNTGGTAPTDANSPYISGSTVTVLGNSGSLAKSGFTFSGWNTAADGSGTTYVPNATFNILSTTILHAVWTLVPPATHTLTYTAGAHGTVTGTSLQTVSNGANGTTVTAVPDAGYHFVNWSDASTTNSRTDTNVTADISVTANFAANPAVSDLSLTKTVDNAAPKAGDTVTYTITLIDTGASATGVVIRDMLPAGLTFVATSSADTVGVYASTTGAWTVGAVSTTTPAILHISATVGSLSSGTVVSNTASVSAGDTSTNNSNDSSSASFTVTASTPAPTPTPTPSGGGGGGGGGGNGPIVGSLPGPSNGIVLGTSTEATDCPMYLSGYIKFGAKNDPQQVIRLQQFLNMFENNSLTVSGSYDAASLAAVHAFQNKYAADILAPWGVAQSTGYIYYTTRKEINTIYCKFTKQFPLDSDQLAEIARIKALGQAFIPSVSMGGSSTGSTSLPQTTRSSTTAQPQKDENAIVGSNNDNANQTASVAKAPAAGGSWWSTFLNWILHR